MSPVSASASLVLIALLLAAGCTTAAVPESDSVPVATNATPRPASAGDYRVPPEIGDGWLTSAPEDVGLSRAPLVRMTEVIRAGSEYRNVHALLIAKGDRLVYEEYFAGEDVRRGQGPQGHVVFDREMRHDLRSVTKSVVAALVGIAIGDTAVRALDRPLLDFFPEYADLATPERRAITLRHALDMTAGLEWDERLSYTDPRNDEIRMDKQADPVRFVLARPVVSAPGSVWNYSGGASQVLTALVERVAGRPFLEFAHAALFGPLGITDVEWVGMSSGVPSGASGLRLRPRDLAKFGLLYSQRGRWQGRQVVPEEWVRVSAIRSIGIEDSIAEFGTGATREQGYGMQWWPGRYHMPYGQFTVIAANGNGGQRVIIVPELQLTVVHHAGLYNAGSDFERLLAERILPWAAGRDTAYEFSAPRAVRLLTAGEMSTVTLDAAERARYVGEYDYEGRTLRVVDEHGVLRVLPPWESDRSPIHLLPLGEHRFAQGLIVAGVAVKVFWPGWRWDFELAEGRAVRILDVASDGRILATANRIR